MRYLLFVCLLISQATYASTDLSLVIKKVTPSVVKITSSIQDVPSDITATENGQQKRFIVDNKNKSTYLVEDGVPKLISRGSGSSSSVSFGAGIIMSSSGYVVTNAHVIGSNTYITVTLYDGREFIAHIIGVDTATDIAVIKFDAPAGITVAQFDDSDDVEVGTRVFAIGSPFELDFSVADGIVSALGRVIKSNTSLVKFIQSNVSINPGNSGGPLFTERGKVIGLNSRNATTPNGGSVGISFSIPSNDVVRISSILITNRTVVRGTVGFMINDINLSIAKLYGLGIAQGALVTEIDPMGPAGVAGLLAGDLITSCNGKRIIDSASLIIMLSELPVGGLVNLSINRKTQTRNITFKIQSL